MRTILAGLIGISLATGCVTHEKEVVEKPVVVTPPAQPVVVTPPAQPVEVVTPAPPPGKVVVVPN
jgi:hypothetical protein